MSTPGKSRKNSIGETLKQELPLQSVRQSFLWQILRSVLRQVGLPCMIAVLITIAVLNCVAMIVMLLGGWSLAESTMAAQAIVLIAGVPLLAALTGTIGGSWMPEKSSGSLLSDAEQTLLNYAASLGAFLLSFAFLLVTNLFHRQWMDLLVELFRYPWMAIALFQCQMAAFVLSRRLKDGLMAVSLALLVEELGTLPYKVIAFRYYSGYFGLRPSGIWEEANSTGGLFHTILRVPMLEYQTYQIFLDLMATLSVVGSVFSLFLLAAGEKKVSRRDCTFGLLPGTLFSIVNLCLVLSVFGKLLLP